MKPMSPEEFTRLMLEISKQMDQEERHVRADGLMCGLLASLGYEQGVEIFLNMDRWYA